MWKRIKKIWKFLLVWLKRILYVAIAYAVLFGLVFAYQMISAQFGDPDADLVDNTDVGKGNRRTNNAAIIESVREQVNRFRTPEYQRDAHAKAHGCVRATFEVFDQDKYAYGIFKEKGSYDAWVRFSNGSVPTLDDDKKDARGMAIKVMNVPGKQLLPELLAGKTQDFVMINSPAFFIRSIEGYRDLMALTAAGKPFTYFFGEHYLNPFKWKLRELYLGLGTRKKAPPTPLSDQYFSMSPYQLGPHEIKYSAKSCEIYEAPSVNRKAPNFLRATMRKVLQEQDACFQFMVQVRDPEARMPIEDTTVVWSEKKSPFVQIARVHIPKQEFDFAEQNEYCEALSYNVWHGVEGMKPLSYLNQLRRDLYLHTSAYRNVRNDRKVGEPTSWCDGVSRYCETPSEDESSDDSGNVDSTLVDAEQAAGITDDN